MLYVIVCASLNKKKTNHINNITRNEAFLSFFFNPLFYQLMKLLQFGPYSNNPMAHEEVEKIK